jgi:phytoene/squalene synthetase
MRYDDLKASFGLAESITKAASKQTYYTIRFLADRGMAQDAYRAYAYFRWVDDVLDGEAGTGLDRIGFLNRQQRLLDGCYLRDILPAPCPEEKLLLNLVSGDTEKKSGLQSYLRNMMSVMAFDADRRGRLISQAELNNYTRDLATAVTEAMHHFIGHCCYSPHDESRYLAVSAAHITHMLRDTCDDIRTGYFNIPREVLEAGHISPQDVGSLPYRSWVRGRVQLARRYFETGREYLGQVQNRRCRLAGYAYAARFESVLNLIEQDGYVLRPVYPERKVLATLLAASRVLLTAPSRLRTPRMTPQATPVNPRAQREP